MRHLPDHGEFDETPGCCEQALYLSYSLRKHDTVSLQIGEGSTPAPPVVLRAYRPFLHSIVAHTFSVARVTAESVTSHISSSGSGSIEDDVWGQINDCLSLCGKCLEEVRAVRLQLVSSGRETDSVYDYDYLPRASATAALQGLTEPAAVRAFASLAITLANGTTASSADEPLDDDDDAVRVAVACMATLSNMALLKISSYTETLQSWISVLTEALQVTLTLTATSVAQQYRSGLDGIRQVAAAANAGGQLSLVSTHSWMHATCQLFWSLMARVSISKLAQRGIVSMSQLQAMHFASVVLLQHWYAVPMGGTEYLLKAWVELARGAAQMASTSQGMYDSLGLHQHVVDVVACITAYHVQMGAVASLDGCDAWALMDNANSMGALQTALYPVSMPVMQGQAPPPDALTGAMAQMRQGSWVDEFNDSAETRRALYLILKQCTTEVLGGVCQFYEGTLFNYTRHALQVADNVHVAASASQDDQSMFTLRVVGSLLRGQCAALMRNLSSLLWPLSMVHKPDTLLVKEKTDPLQAALEKPAAQAAATGRTAGQSSPQYDGRDPQHAFQAAVSSLMSKLLGPDAAGMDFGGMMDGGVQSLQTATSNSDEAFTAASAAAIVLQWMFDIMLLSLGACLPRVATGQDTPDAAPAEDSDMSLSGVAQKGLDMTNAALEALVNDLAAVSLGDAPAAPAAAAADSSFKTLSPEQARAAVKQLHTLMFASRSATASERSHTWLEGSILDCFTPFWHVYVKERKQGALAVTSAKLRSGLSHAAASMSQHGWQSNPLHSAGEAAWRQGSGNEEGITPLLARFLHRMKLTHPHELVDMMMMKLVANLRAGEASGEAGVRACPVSGGVDQVVTQTVVTFTSMVDHVVPRSSSNIMAALPPALTDLLCTLTVRTLVTRSPAVLFPLLSHPKYGRWRTYVYLALSRLLFSHARVLSSPTQPLDAAAEEAVGPAGSAGSLLEEALKAEVVQQLGIADSSSDMSSMQQRGPVLGAMQQRAASGPSMNPVTGNMLGASAAVDAFDFASGTVQSNSILQHNEIDTGDALDEALKKVKRQGSSDERSSSNEAGGRFEIPFRRMMSGSLQSRNALDSMVPHLTAKLTHSGALALRHLGPDWFLGFITPLEAVGASLHTLLSTGFENQPSGALLGQTPALGHGGAGGVRGGGGSDRPTVDVPEGLVVRVIADAPQLDTSQPTGLLHAVAYTGRVTEQVAQLLHQAARTGSARTGGEQAVTISLSDKFAVIGWLRDLRGLVWASSSNSEYAAVFDWFRHRHVHLLGVMAWAFRYDFDVLKPLVRLCLTLANNTTHRVSFSPHDGGGVLLYRSMTRVICSVADNLMQGTLANAAKTAITSSAGQLTEESVTIKMVRLLCTTADCVLSGQFVNTALLTTMGDSAPEDLRKCVIQVVISVDNDQLQGFAKLPPTWSHVLVSLLRFDRGAGTTLWGMPSPVLGALLERLLVLMQTHAASRQREVTVEDDGSRHCEDPRVFSSTCHIMKHLLVPLVRAQYTMKLFDMQKKKAEQEAAQGGDTHRFSAPLGVDPSLHNLFLARHRVSELGEAKSRELLAAFQGVARQRPQLWQRYLELFLYTAISCPASVLSAVASALSPPLVLLLYCLPDETIKAAVSDVVGVVCHAVTLTESSTAQQQAQEAELVQLLQLMVSKAVKQLDADAEEAVARGMALTDTDDHLVEAPWVSQLTKSTALVRELMEWAAMQH